ncbi:MAG TPA: helix-turn-helix domain-containing protein [Chloroflexia bacterium]|nr:helix-turn-helix domain-containing protein [Chloroflexia bacterium]
MNNEEKMKSAITNDEAPARLAYTIKETCRLLSISRFTLRKEALAGRIKIIGIPPTGRNKRVEAAEIDRYLKARRIEQEAKMIPANKLRRAQRTRGERK